jgi:hypothetical protein
MAAVDRALQTKQAKKLDEAKVLERKHKVPNFCTPLTLLALVKCGDEAEGVTKERDAAESQIFEYKLPYYSRRAQSKSEPSQASQGSDGADVDNELLLSLTGKQMSPVSME